MRLYCRVSKKEWSLAGILLPAQRALWEAPELFVFTRMTAYRWRKSTYSHLRDYTMRALCGCSSLCLTSRKHRELMLWSLTQFLNFNRHKNPHWFMEGGLLHYSCDIPSLLGVISKQSLPLEKSPLSWSIHQKRDVTIQYPCKEKHGLCYNVNTEMLVTGSTVTFLVLNWWLRLVRLWKI